MEKKCQYSSDAERQRLLTDNAVMILVEEQKITEGNFLIFADQPRPTPIFYTYVPQEEFENVKSAQAEILLAMVMNNLM